MSNYRADLVSYLPPFMAEYEEINAALTAENPELTLLWDGKERVLKNQFILTADSEGLARFEGLLGIVPSKSDTLESRRQRVLLRWFLQLPYTERMLLEKLVNLCGEGNFTFTKNYDRYQIRIEASLELYGQTKELEELLERMIPCNINVVSRNRVECRTEGSVEIFSGIRVTERVLVTNDFRERASVKGNAGAAGAVVQVMHAAVSQQ